MSSHSPPSHEPASRSVSDAHGSAPEPSGTAAAPDGTGGRAPSSDTTRAVLEVARLLLGDDPPVSIVAPDGTRFGSDSAPATILLRSDDAVYHLLWAPGELGFARAYVSGALDIEGDIWAVVDLHRRLPDISLGAAQSLKLARRLGRTALTSPPPPPPEEVDIGRPWSRHSKKSDAAAISHHYDVSNDFYGLVLGPSWTYSCAVFESDEDSLEQAQANKYELICRKLGLEPGMRLLDVGCGWGGMVLHAARHHGVEAVGITISTEQAALARDRVRRLGLEDQIEIRLQDYRDLGEETFDAISSIGMFEHVGADQLRRYFRILHGRLEPSGRVLNHQIGRTPPTRPRRWPGQERTAVHRRGFIHRYVFPNGELHEIGDLVGSMQRVGFEVRHVETLREHYARTLRCWVDNLDTHWDEATRLVGERRARVWRLYLAASGAQFAHNSIQVHQVLATKTVDGASGVGWRPDWNGPLAATPVIDLRP